MLNSKTKRTFTTRQLFMEASRQKFTLFHFPLGKTENEPCSRKLFKFIRGFGTIIKFGTWEMGQVWAHQVQELGHFQG